MQRFEYDKVTAMNLSLSLGNYEGFMLERRHSELRGLLNEYRSDQLEFREKYEEMVTDLKHTADEQSSQAELAIKNSNNLLQRRMDAIKRLSRRGTRSVQIAANAAKQKHDEAMERLEAADAAYTEQLGLKYSVKYWAGRKRTHTFSKYAWLLFVFLSLALTLGTMGLYFANGGLSNISENLSKRFPSFFVDLPEKNEKVFTKNGSVQDVLSKTEVASLAANITGAILLITALSILIRITLRQFSIHTQYELAAGERVTFIKTYLALMKEEQIKSDEDRKLILDCIFKSTLGSSAPEVSFSLPIDSIIKTMGEKKSFV
ncbi:hypothetical protein ACP9OK_01600 [Pseudomonas sp. B11]